MSKGSMREQMPQVAELIDKFRAAFGDDNINTVIKRGMRGEPVFYATENGHTVGTPPEANIAVGLDARGNRRRMDGKVDPEITKYQARMMREQNQRGRK